MNLCGYDEAEWFQVVHEMPLRWTRSVGAWVAIRASIDRLRRQARFYFERSEHRMCAQCLAESRRIQIHHGIKPIGGGKWGMR